MQTFAVDYFRGLIFTGDIAYVEVMYVGAIAHLIAGGVGDILAAILLGPM
jgi:hypothetical protein